jgi:hypothetical protein
MGRLFPLALLAFSAAGSALATATASAQRGAGAEWPIYGGDAGHTRYSSLNQIRPPPVRRPPSS